jgi:hypothetical protein
MKMKGWKAAVAAICLLAGMTLLIACSSSSPTAPTGIGQGKALYRGEVMEADGTTPVVGAKILVDDVDSGEVTDSLGVFEVELPPGMTYNIKAVVGDPGVEVLVYEDIVTVNEADIIVIEDEEAVSNGIGPCVSECVRLYKPGNGETPAGLRELGATKNGKFNATPCVEFCKTNYRGGLPGGPNCNPFYENYNGQSGECVDEEPAVDPVVDPLGPAEAADGIGIANPKKPKKPKSNNGNGNGNS